MSAEEEWLVSLLLVLIVVLVVAFFLYLLGAYRKGGWREVRVSLILAAVALVALYVVRVAENSEIRQLKDAITRSTQSR